MLSFILAKSASQLLDKDRLGIGRPQEKYHIDPRNIYTFIQNIHCEQDLQLRRIILQILIGPDTLSDGIPTGQIRRVIVLLHRLGHPDGMGDIAAKCQCLQFLPLNTMLFYHV